jgi:hypothetical protein
VESGNGLAKGVVVKESELDIIVYYLARDKEKGGSEPF